MAHAIPIPESLGGERVVLGESDPTRMDVRPCEYLVTESKLYPGRFVFSALVEFTDVERVKLGRGSRVWLHLDGAEVPWSIDVTEGGG